VAAPRLTSIRGRAGCCLPLRLTANQATRHPRRYGPAVAALRLFTHEAVLRAVSPAEAIERVRSGFVEHASGEWEMPPKTYIQAPPGGDFRAMPAKGGGIAILKWVTSFPGNPAAGLPVVMGAICVSSATTGELLALVDVRAVTALRTGAVAAVAAQELARPDAQTVGIVGCGLHGAWAARCLADAEYGPGVCFDPDPDAAGRLAGELGWEAGGLDDALGCDVVTCVTPGAEPVIAEADVRPGVHLNMLGADGPGKAEADPAAVARCQLFCDEWEQASHGGELTGAVSAGLVEREQVTQLGDVLTGAAPGRSGPEAVTLFDSTGLAIQDLAICLALLEAERDGRVRAQTVNL
jgi:ornithine cyclodeaminase/alanine dehydrogenase-like protein (mu-crystallin family)